MTRQPNPQRNTKRRAPSRRRKQENRTRQSVRPTSVSRNSERARQQRARRRRKNQVIFRMICGLLICAAIVLAPTVFFRVSHITVTGDTRYTEQELIDISGVQEGDNMFFLDFDHIAQTLQKEYPYLDTVKLHRKLPSTLQIEVTDCIAALSVQVDNGYLLMDMDGKVLEKTDEIADNTAEVIGAQAGDLEVGNVVGKKKKKLQTVLDLMNLMTQYGMNDKVDRVDIGKAYDVRMRFDDRYTILLGNLSELEHKIQFLQAILKETSLPETGIIDLTDDKEAHYRPDDTTNSVENQDNVEENTTDPAEIDPAQTDPAQTDPSEIDPAESGTDGSADQVSGDADQSSDQEEETDVGAQDGDNSGENADA